jgi:hypothetical protein
MTREDKLKLVVTAIENMVATRIAISNNQVGYHIDRAEYVRQELLRALVQHPVAPTHAMKSGSYPSRCRNTMLREKRDLW